MSAEYLIDGQPVYAPAFGRPGGVLHRAVVQGRSTVPWAGCCQAHRLDEDRLLFADEIGTGRLCAPTGCTGRPNRGRGGPPTHR
ncbi:hypothetical protein [Kitasatospora sp. NPDC001175]|uniref:hypothetical protein n=1 Tax=Kitasatospora sp. NPDC001175 TaxID=3157103 RepID=UPI003CFE3F67